MIKRLICKLFGHKWQQIPFGYMVDILPNCADSICLRCGYTSKTKWKWYGGYGVSSSKDRKEWIIRGE